MGWKLVDVSGAGVQKAEIFEILEGTYGFEPMPEELNLFITKLNLNDESEGFVTWETFQAGLQDIRETVNKVAKDANQYETWLDMRDALVKHKRCPKGPMQIYKHPMTTLQAIGWNEEDVFNERFPKSSCEETRYMDCLVKSGWRM